MYSNTNDDGLKESIKYVILGHSRIDLQTMTSQVVAPANMKVPNFVGMTATNNAKLSQSPQHSLDIIQNGQNISSIHGSKLSDDGKSKANLQKNFGLSSNNGFNE